MSKRATIKDIALAAGTSTTAVSLTLNNRPNRLSDKTKDHIRRVAKNLKYVPNQSARTLVNRRSMFLGLIIPDIENRYFAALSKHVSDEANQNGYTLIIANSNDSSQLERTLLTQFRDRDVDAIMLVPSLESFDHPEDFRTLIESLDRPIALLDRISALPWCDGIGINNFKGGRLVANYLLQKGHIRCGVIAARSEYMHKDGRIEAFLQTMRRRGHPLSSKCIAEGNFRYEGGYSGIDLLLEQEVTAIFCGNDLTALGARKRILELGLKVPSDISIIGYDNSMASLGLGADLTTVDQNIPLIAKIGVETVVERIEEVHQSRLLVSNENQLSFYDDTSRMFKPWLAQPQQKMFDPLLIERSTVATYKVQRN